MNSLRVSNGKSIAALSTSNWIPGLKPQRIKTKMMSSLKKMNLVVLAKTLTATTKSPITTTRPQTQLLTRTKIMIRPKLLRTATMEMLRRSIST